MDQILGAVFTSPNSRTHPNDDFADRLSSRYTVIQLIIFSALIGFSQVSIVYTYKLLYLYYYYYYYYNDVCFEAPEV